MNILRNFGGITSFQAFQDLRVTRLSAKIYNLKKQGYNIVDEMKTSKNRDGEKIYFKKYMLVEEKLVEENEIHIPTL